MDETSFRKWEPVEQGEVEDAVDHHSADDPRGDPINDSISLDGSGGRDRHGRLLLVSKRFRWFDGASRAAGSCFGGVGRPGDATLPIGAALTTTMRRTSVTFIARTIARVPCQAIPAFDADRGPRPESTASAPPTADSRAAGSGAARSALTARTPGDSFWGFRTTAVTS